MSNGPSTLRIGDDVIVNPSAWPCAPGRRGHVCAIDTVPCTLYQVNFGKGLDLVERKAWFRGDELTKMYSGGDVKVFR